MLPYSTTRRAPELTTLAACRIARLVVHHVPASTIQRANTAYLLYPLVCTCMFVAARACVGVLYKCVFCVCLRDVYLRRRGTELLVALDDLVNGLQEILLSYCLSPRPDSVHASLSAHRADVGTGRVGAETRQQLVTNVALAVHGARMDLTTHTHMHGHIELSTC